MRKDHLTSLQKATEISPACCEQVQTPFNNLKITLWAKSTIKSKKRRNNNKKKMRYLVLQNPNKANLKIQTNMKSISWIEGPSTKTCCLRKSPTQLLLKNPSRSLYLTEIKIRKKISFSKNKGQIPSQIPSISQLKKSPINS